MPQRRSTALLLSSAIAWPTVAFGGRPLDTDDAAIIPQGSCQLETFARRVDGTDRTGEFGFAPSCNPFGWGEILVGGGRSAVGTADASSQGVLQIKGVPMQVTRSRPGWGYDLAVEEDFVRGRSRPAARLSNIDVITSMSLSAAWQVDANVGWVHAWAPAIDPRDHLLYGIAAEWTLSRSVTLVAERFATRGWAISTQFGATFAVSPRVTLDAAIGRRRSGDSRASVATIGLTLASRPTPPMAP